MIYNIIASLASAFLFIHNVNTIKEDYNTPFEDCKVLGCEDGSLASKARWGSKLVLGSIGAASYGLLFVDSISGGNIRTKAIREFLGGFESADDLKEKCSNVEEEILGKKESVKKQPQLMETVPQNQPITADCAIGCCVENTDSSSAQERKSDVSEQESNRENNESECSLEESSVNDSSDDSLDNSSDDASNDSSNDSSTDSYESKNEISAPVAV